MIHGALNHIALKDDDNWFISRSVAYTMTFIDSSILIGYLALLYCLFIRKTVKREGETKKRVQLSCHPWIIIIIYLIGFFLGAANWITYILLKVYSKEQKELPFEKYSEAIDLGTVEFAVINLQLILFEMYSLYCTFTSMK